MRSYEYNYMQNIGLKYDRSINVYHLYNEFAVPEMGLNQAERSRIFNRVYMGDHFICLFQVKLLTQGHPTSIFEKYLFGRRFEI